jgi:tetratricopeptide (TPR) repeat protein
MALSEIEKLERRYAENPQGLTFAPLAEVHRKSGEVRRALALLGPGLQIHPDYIPASIVLGRCHMDLGDVHAAETAFLHVLALDGENVIALKALADISERLLKFEEAERWLQTLLSVDRSNDDAREQLQRVEVSRRQAGVASSAEPSSVPEPQTDIGPPPREDLEPSVRLERPAEPAGMQLDALARPEEPARFGDSVELEDSIELDTSIEFETSPGLEASVERETSVEPIGGLIGREVDAPDDPPGDFRVETSEDIVLESAGGSEFQMPDASQEFLANDARAGRAPFEEDAPVAPSAAWEAPAELTQPETAESNVAMTTEESLRRGAYSSPEPTAPEPPAPEPVPTPEPVASEPVAPESIVAPAYGPGDFRSLRRADDRDAAQPLAAPPKRSYSVGEKGGRSVAHLFKGILSARPPSQASAAPVRPGPGDGSAGAPTRPAADALSLSSVFGEEASETPPAVPAPTQGTGSGSFDDFFTSPSASPTRTPRAPDPKSDDLDQFHAWLQNLKR